MSEAATLKSDRGGRDRGREKSGEWKESLGMSILSWTAG